MEHQRRGHPIQSHRRHSDREAAKFLKSWPNPDLQQLHKVSKQPKIINSARIITQ